MIKLKSEFTQNHDLEHLGWGEIKVLLGWKPQSSRPSLVVGLGWLAPPQHDITSRDMKGAQLYALADNIPLFMLGILKVYVRCTIQLKMLCQSLKCEVKI